MPDFPLIGRFTPTFSKIAGGLQKSPAALIHFAFLLCNMIGTVASAAWNPLALIGVALAFIAYLRFLGHSERAAETKQKQSARRVERDAKKRISTRARMKKSLPPELPLTESPDSARLPSNIEQPTLPGTRAMEGDDHA